MALATSSPAAIEDNSSYHNLHIGIMVQNLPIPKMFDVSIALLLEHSFVLGPRSFFSVV